MLTCPKCGKDYSLGRNLCHSCEEFSISHRSVFNRDCEIHPWNCQSKDEVDKTILNIIQSNDKISYRELSEKLKLSVFTIYNRVRKIIQEEMFSQLYTILEPLKVGYKTIALIGLTVDPIEMKDIANKIASFEETQFVAISSGDHDIIAQIIAKDEKSLRKFINIKIKPIKGIKPHIYVSSFLEIYKTTPLIKIA